MKESANLSHGCIFISNKLISYQINTYLLVVLGFFLFLFLFFFCFLGSHLWQMEVPRLGVKSELQLLGYTTATTMQDPSCVCNLHHISWQCRIPNSLSEARIESTSSWLLVGFLTTESQQELLDNVFFLKKKLLFFFLLIRFV